MAQKISIASALAMALVVAAQAQTYSLFGAETPSDPAVADPNAVTLGLVFFSTQPGTISSIQFYRGRANSNGYVTRLYTAAGSMLGQVMLPGDAHNFQAGWKTATFVSPIPISAGTNYVAAYYTSNGDYAATDFGLSNGAVNGPLRAPATGVGGGNGVYAYGKGFHFPTQTYEDSNYFVDVLFNTPMLMGGGGGGGGSAGCPFTGPCATAANTGYKAAPDYVGQTLGACPIPFQSNTTYNFFKCDGGTNIGTSSTPVTNVKIHGCLITANVASGDFDLLLFGSGPITIEYCTFAPTGAAPPPVAHSTGYQYGVQCDGAYNTFVNGLTFTHNEMYGFANATDCNGSTQTAPQVYSYNYLHDARADGGTDHTDGFGLLSGQTNGGSYVTIDHNTVISVGNTQGISWQVQACNNFTWKYNYVSGFGYTIDPCAHGGTVTNFEFSNNVLGTDIAMGFGPLYGWTATTGSRWACNKIHFVPGTTWTDGNGWHPTAAEDGLFWIPASPDPSSSTDYLGNTTCP